MKTFVKPNVVSSKCIEFAHCRYNGNIITSEVVRELKNYVNFIPVCPEVEIGLRVPRKSIRIIQEGEDLKLVQSSTGLDVTEKMNTFANEFLESLKDVDGFILKYKSPSCGTKNTPLLKNLDICGHAQISS